MSSIRTPNYGNGFNLKYEVRGFIWFHKEVRSFKLKKKPTTLSEVVSCNFGNGFNLKY